MTGWSDEPHDRLKHFPDCFRSPTEAGKGTSSVVPQLLLEERGFSR
jgi:hypothetical protein